MAKDNMSDELRAFFGEQRRRERTMHTAIQDLRAIESYNQDLGKTDIGLAENITKYELEDQKLDRSLKKRGF